MSENMSKKMIINNVSQSGTVNIPTIVTFEGYTGCNHQANGRKRVCMLVDDIIGIEEGLMHYDNPDKPDEGPDLINVSIINCVARSSTIVIDTYEDCLERWVSGLKIMQGIFEDIDSELPVPLNNSSEAYGVCVIESKVDKDAGS